MTTHLVILGAGGHGNAVAETASLLGQFTEITFLDDAWPTRSQVRSWSIVGDFSRLTLTADGNHSGIAAVGNNPLRKKLINEIKAAGLKVATIIHPSAFVSPTARVDIGCVIMAGAVVGPNATLGEGCIVNCNATVDHDTELGDYVHLGVGVSLAGGTKIGDNSFLPAGCTAGYGVVLEAGTIATPGTIFLPR